MMSYRWTLLWALTPLVSLPALAQSVISAHSGLIHFIDGSVLLDDQPIQQQTGKFDQMNNGSELRTEDGHAEVLLTPGTFVRLGPNSAIRMISNQLDDTRVELLSGSAMVDQGSDKLANTSVTVLYNLDQVQVKAPGRYRFDSQPPQVKVETGEAQIQSGDKSVQAAAGYVVPLDGKLATRKLLNQPTANSGDDLDRWDQTRDNTVAQNNQDAADTNDLAKTIDGWKNDPDAVLQSLGIPPYIPGMSSMVPPPGYGSYGYGSGLYSPYGSGLYSSSLYGSALYGPGIYGFGLAPYSLYGLGPVSPLFVYGMPLYRYGSLPYGYRGYTGYSGYTGLYGRSGITPVGGRVGYGYAPTRSLGIGRPSIGAGRPAIGGIHAVGGHR